VRQIGPLRLFYLDFAFARLPSWPLRKLLFFHAENAKFFAEGAAAFRPTSFSGLFVKKTALLREMKGTLRHRPITGKADQRPLILLGNTLSH
jgi:hypothetical protein